MIVISDKRILALQEHITELHAEVIAGFNRIGVKMSAIDDELQDLQGKVGNLTSVVQSAETLIGGIAGQIKAAVDAAVANGVPQSDLDELKQLGDSIDQAASGLAAAVAANTPSGGGGGGGPGNTGTLVAGSSAAPPVLPNQTTETTTTVPTPGP